jgi:hypothetical protein
MAKQTFTTGQVLTAAQMTSLQQTAMLGGAASAKTASYTLVAADAGTAISMDNASATTITVNTALFAAGDTVHITNLGAGVCTITAGTATVNSSASLALAQYESGFLDFTSTSAAIFVKGAGAVSGGMTLLSTTSLSGATTVISGISGSYKDLMIYVYGVTNATADGDLRVAPNGTTNITYAIGQYGDAGAANTTFVEGTATYLFLTLSAGVSGRSFGTNSFVLRIPDYANTSYEKSFYHEGQYQLGGSAPAFIHSTGRIGTTSAISSLTFSNSGGNLSTGTVQVYGVK